jgi:hypothetical protein
MNFDHCNTAYLNCESIVENGVFGSAVEFPELQEFNDVRKRFSSIVRDGGFPEIWEDGVKLFALIHAKLARTPCRPCWLTKEILNSPRGLEILSELKSRAITADPQIRMVYLELTRILEKIETIEISPLLQHLSKINIREGKTLFVLRDTKLLPEVRSCLSSIQSGADWELVRPSALRTQMTGSAVVIFGPPWYLQIKNELYLIRSPAAPVVYMIGCAHEFSGEIIFTQLALDKKLVAINGSEEIRDCPSINPWVFEDIKPVERGSFSFKEKSENRMFLSGTNISAVPFRFSGGKGTFFKADSKVWTAFVQPVNESYKCGGVEKIDVEDLDCGHLVLMTGGGGGDMVSAVADMILNDAEKIRSLQLHWKVALRKAMTELGWQNVAKELQKHGSERATYPNMLNWCQPRRIGMEDLNTDLRAVLRFLNMSDQMEEVITGIRHLRAAHQSAGRQLATKLRRSLLGKDLTDAISQGSLVFQENDGPELIVFLVEERGKSTEIPEEWEGEIRDVDE